MNPISLNRLNALPPEQGTEPGMPLLRLGFRPFYLLAAAFAALAVPLWLLAYYGILHAPRVDLVWHVHEMVFGFAIAVIIGFLYTAGRNWTGLWTPRGIRLAAIAGAWLAGRIAMLAAEPLVAAAVDVAFLPLAAWPFFQVLKRSGNRRNFPMVGLLGLLAFANAVFHASRLGWIGISPLQPIHAAIMLIVVIESIIGGRVIPMFTANATSQKPVTDAKRDRIGMALTIATALAWAFSMPRPIAASLAIAAAAAQFTRLAGWKPMHTLRHPLLWVLHLSYAWIPFGFLLLAMSSFGWVSASTGFHVLAVGSMSGLIIDMITRTALGHTGRQLKAGASETAMYLLLQAGVLARFIAALGMGDVRDVMLVTAAVCWSAAFFLYVISYGPKLMAPRVDGREG